MGAKVRNFVVAIEAAGLLIFAHMKYLMSFVYLLLKAILKPALYLYHRRIVIVGKKILRKHQGPCILVTNHPATLLDPLNAAAAVPHQVHFLANAGLFKTPFGKWFFSTFYCIPVQRYEDTGGKPLNNEQSFAAARSFLASGGCLFIAPESTSLPVKHLRKLKTGTARIGLSAEAAHDFRLNLVVQPIGLHYDNSRKFRSRLLMNVGRPLPFAPFREMYERDPRRAVRAFTDALQEHMSRLVLNTRDQEEEELIPLAEEMLQTEGKQSMPEQFKHMRKLIENWHRLRDEEPQAWAAFRQKAQQLQEMLRQYKLRLHSLKAGRATPRSMFLLLLGLPPALYGFLNNALPAIAVCRLSHKLNRDPSYEPTFKFVIALIAFPLCYGLQTWAFAKFVPLLFPLATHAHAPLYYLLSLIPAGIFYEWYAERLQNFLSGLRYQRLLSTRTEQMIALQLLVEEVKSLGFGTR